MGEELSNLLKPSTDKIGAPPGTLTYTGTETSDTVIKLFQFNKDEIFFHDIHDIEDLEKKLSKQHVNWIELTGFKNIEQLSQLGSLFNIDQLKKKSHELRKELRNVLFAGCPQPDGSLTFIPKNLVSEGMKCDGRVWRIKIGNNPLKKDDIIMMGGGNPAHIPEVEKAFKERLAQLTEDEYSLKRLIGIYDPPQGEIDFIDAMVNLLNQEYGWGLSKRNVALTNGSQAGFFNG